MMDHSTRLPQRVPPASDEALWELFCQGDRAGYRALYSNYLNDLYTYGCYIVADQELVKDQIQELFIDLWKYKEGLHTVHNVRQYLLKALRNRINKVLRQNKNVAYDAESSHPGQPIVLPIEHTLIDQQTQQDNKRRLQRAMLTLSARQREVISLLFYEKRSYEEAASLMEINVRSAYTLAWKALAALRKELRSLAIGLLVFLA